MSNQKLSEEKKFYVYGLYDPNEHFPFYVGKGTGNRMNNHTKGRCKGKNDHKDKKIAKIKRQGREPYAKKIFQNLTERKAYNREWALIHILDATPKCKLTNIRKSWGRGLNGVRNKQTKEKISNTLKGKYNGEEIKNSKLTAEQVKEIKWVLESDKKVKLETLADHYGVSKPTIAKISSEEYWTHVQKTKKPNVDFPETRFAKSTISGKKAKEIKWLAEKPEHNSRKIAEKYGIHKTTVIEVKKRTEEEKEPEEKPKYSERTEDALVAKAAGLLKKQGKTDKTYRKIGKILGRTGESVSLLARGKTHGYVDPKQRHFDLAKEKVL